MFRNRPYSETAAVVRTFHYIFVACGLAACVLGGGRASAADPTPVPSAPTEAPSTAAATITPTGIALDAPWKVAVYARATTSYVHPAWGRQHSERNYVMALRLAAGDGLTIDRDIVFAACFLHDLSAFDPLADHKMEHGDDAARVSERILRDAGFPMQKYPRVAAAERTHMYYRDPGSAPESIVLHDADSLDFLGDIGAARMIALTGEKTASFSSALRALRTFTTDIPPKLVTHTARTIGAMRLRELQAFLDRIDVETDGGRAI